MAEMLPPEVIRAMQSFRALLDARELRTMMEMAERWARLERNVAARLAALTDEIALRQAQGQQVTAGMVGLSQRYVDLQVQIQEQVDAYADFAAGRITQEQRWMARAGVGHAQALLKALPRGGVAGAFNVLPTEALELMAGYTANGSPLRAYFARLYPSAAQGIMDALMTGLARGMGATELARHLRDGMGVAPRTAMNSARTEPLRVYREASLEQYRKSGRVDGYIRVAAKSERTCMACLAQDGQWFPLTTAFEEHNQGRCRPVPAREGQAYPGTNGLDWFNKQSPERQREMLGAKRYEAWKAGEFDLRDIAKLHKDPVWGNAWQERSLKELLALPKSTDGGAAQALVDVSHLQVGKFVSLEEAQAWGKATYPQIDWDFRGAHIDAINPTMAQFDRLAKLYPDVAERIQYLGTRQIKWPYTFADQGVLAHAAGGRIMGLNPIWYGDPQRLRSTLTDAVQAGYLPRGHDTIEAILTHEFSHHVMTWLVDSDRTFIPRAYVQSDGFGLVRQAVDSFLQNSSSRARIALGGRAKESLSETWALAFVSRYHAPARQQGVIARNLGQLLEIIMSRRDEITVHELAELYALLEKIGAVSP